MVEMKLILQIWPTNKHIDCNINNDIPVRIPSFPHVLLNRSVLCNCEIRVEKHFLLESWQHVKKHILN